jgi:undecaprenyl diphosphate synthase
MIQSTLRNQNRDSFHVAIIMDGNGRWATRQGLPRIEGHKAGTRTVRRIVEAAPTMGIDVLTVYAFSSDNWKRPADEVNKLMGLLYEYMIAEKMTCVSKGIRLSVIGRRDRLSYPLKLAIEGVEEATEKCAKLHFRIAIDYSSKDSILRAATQLTHERDCTRERFTQLLGEVTHAGEYSPDVDLLIRTAGEQRLSDYLLWESAYAELYFTQKTWPEFDEEELQKAVDQYRKRERKFGALPVAVSS